MSKKLISLLLANALVLFVCNSSLGASLQGEKEAKETADVKARIAKLEIPTQVEITLHDKTKLKGFVQKTAEDHFVISDLKTAAVTNVAYTQVKQIKHVKDHHLSEHKLNVIATVIILGLAVWASSSNKP